MEEQRCGLWKVEGDFEGFCCVLRVSWRGILMVVGEVEQGSSGFVVVVFGWCLCLKDGGMFCG